MSPSTKSFRVSSPNRKIQDIPNIPTIGTPAVSVLQDSAVDVPFTIPTPVTGGIADQYRAISTPGNFQGISSGSPVTVPGLTGGTSYTFKVRGETSSGATLGFTPDSFAIVPEFGAMEAIATVDFLDTVVFNFGNIPQNYQDLMIVINGVMSVSPSNATIDDINLGFAGASPATSSTAFSGNGSSATSERTTNQTNQAIFSTSGNSPMVANANSIIVHILNYSSSTLFKTVLSRKASDNNGSGNTNIIVNSIRTTSPLRYFKYSTQNGDWFFRNGTASLYGIKASI